WVLDGLSWQYTAEQALRVLASPIRPNGELWFLWTLALFFVIGRLTAKFSPLAQVATAASASLTWMTLIEPLLPEIIYHAIGSGWHGIFRYYFLFAGFALYSKHIRTAVSHLKWHTSALLFCIWLDASLLAAYYDIPPNASLFILSLLGVAGGIGLANLIGRAALLRYLGRQTLPIYLAPRAIIAIFLCRITALGLAPLVTFTLYLSTLVLTCVIIACALGLSQLKPLKYMYQPPAFPSERVTPPSKRKSAA